MNSSKFHKFLQWLERELCAVLAIGVVGLAGAWTMAGTVGTSTLSVTVSAPAGSITVTDPNGGESWTVGSSQNITWTSTGIITNVKIELQRTVAGSWETIVASTTDDGIYSWLVDGSATTTATVRISKATDASVNDVSDATFSIVVGAIPPGTPSGGGGGGGAGVHPPFIGNGGVQPDSFMNTTDVILDVRGVNFEYNTIFKLGDSELRMIWNGDSSHVRLKVPKGFKPGKYVLGVYNSDGTLATWDKKIEVKGMYYSASLTNQSSKKIELTAGGTAEVWVEFVNTSNESWLTYGRNITRLGTAQPRDRKSVFWRSGWISRNRPANVQKPDLKGRQVIKPGEVGRFVFKIRAPKTPGKYVEYFSPVAEYLQWMDVSVSWDITVVSKSSKTKTTIPSTVKKPTASQSGSGILPMPNLPEGPTEFYDGVEAWLKSFSNFFGRLVGGLTRM